MNNNEYELISLEVEYPGIQGGCKWAVATDLSREELFQKYGKELSVYDPLLLISNEQAEVFKEYRRNEEKHKKRQYRCHDPRGYIEGNEQNQQASGYEGSLDSVAESATDYLMNLMVQLAIERLSETQQRRIRMYYGFDFTEREIALIEGVSQASVHESIQSALNELRRLFF